jgi:chromosome partitioning protein
MIISVVNHKGGTGKTTTVVNLATFLKDEGFKVLIVDMDPQANMSYSLGIENASKTVSNIMMGEPFETVALRKNGIDIIPASMDLYSKEDEFFNVKNKYFLLKKTLKQLAYDFVLIDCPPAFSLYTLNSLCASEKVLIPIQFDVLSIKGLTQLIEVIKDVKGQANPELEIIGVLGVIVDPRRQLTREIMAFLKENFESKVFENYIRSNVRAAEAPSFAKSVLDYAPNSKSAVDYVNFGKEFLETLNIEVHEKA